MHSHDDALISALAEGSLDPSQAAAAEAAIADCSRCRTELTAQRDALAALRSAPAAVLGEEERLALRAAVSSALGLETAPERRERRRTVPWGAVAVAAVSLAAIVAVVPLAGLLGTAADSDDAATALAVTTVASEAPADGGAPLEVTSLEGAERDLASAGEEGELGTQPDATFAETTTTVVGPPTGLTLDEIAARLATGTLESLVAADDAAAACSAEADALLGTGAVSLIDAVLVDGVPGVGYVAANGSAAAVFDPLDCSRLAVLP